MCVYSNMMDQWRHPTWPDFPKEAWPAQPTVSPNAIPWPQIVADPNLAQQMLDILAKLEAMDKRLDNIDCKVERVAKRKLEAKLKRIAAKKKKRKTTAKQRTGDAK